MRSGLFLGVFALASPAAMGAELPASSDAPAKVASAEERIVDRVAAVVDGKALSLSELELEARVALIERGGTEAAQEDLGLEVAVDALDYVIGQRLAAAEAERLDVFAADEAEVVKELRSFAEHFASATAYRAFLAREEVSEEALAAIFRRNQRAAKLLDSRVRLKVRVSDAEVKRALAEQNLAAQAPGDDAFAAARAALVRQRYQAAATEELKELRRRAEVRVLLRPRRPEPSRRAVGAP